MTDPGTDDVAARAQRDDAEDAGLDPAVLDADPLVELRRLRDAYRACDPAADADAVVLATSSLDGRPSARYVLVRAIDDRGLVFHTNRASAKGRDLEVNPQAAIAVHYPELRRQFRVQGRVELLEDEASDAYWASRPRASQLAAATSPQSEVVPDRAWLEERLADLEATIDARDGVEPGTGTVRRPTHWGGYRLVPETVELWAQRRGRLHDRVRYRLVVGAWVRERLAP